MSKQKFHQKPPLTRERILREAVKHADVHGIEGLNMRALAHQLDAGVMSIYHHVANKEALLDAMVEWVAGEIELPKPGQAWRAAILSIATSAHRLFLKHRWVNALWSNRGPGPAKLAHMEAILRVLREGGFSIELACRGYHAVTTHTTGFTLQELDFPIDAGNMEAAASNFLAGADPEAIPYFVEHVRHHLEYPEPRNEFEFMLNMILDGLESSAGA
jgi:AcrR family transcriptional regulator